jgi:hypothetical protein
MCPLTVDEALVREDTRGHTCTSQLEHSDLINEARGALTQTRIHP